MRWSYDQLKKQRHVKIHLGCGGRNTPGWTNIDARREAKPDLQRDLRDALPFETGSALMIYSEHLLEHLFKEEAIQLLRECFRILMLGGTIRIGVPDARRSISALMQKAIGNFLNDYDILVVLWCRLRHLWTSSTRCSEWVAHTSLRGITRPDRSFWI
jgi:predicted SAM-dependent methyltransferase